MCGIAGFVQSEPRVPPEVINSQLRLLEHRGPDSSGVFTGRRAVIGQTRLAVIDLVTGDPPIHNEDHSVGAALNGEIYNFKELRDDLIGRGHHLKTEGDTEAIAHLAEDLDPISLASSLDGMFAFAVWDESRHRLILGRDRLGKKPLYYWHSKDSFVFASELQALLAHPDVSARIDPEVVPAYLTFGYVPSPRTFYEGVFSVPPGHVLTVDEHMNVAIAAYWEPRIPGADDVDRLDLTVEAAGKEVRARLEAAVARRLVSDVPLGAFLSGGIDSSAIVGIMSGLLDQPVKTFTIGFEDTEGFDERVYARAVASRFKTDHVEFVVTPDAVELVEKLVWLHGQPFGDSSAIPTFLLSELTRKEVTVAVSGDGGDELFAGYERFAAALLLERLALIPPTVRRAIDRALGLLRSEWLSGRTGSGQRLWSGLELGLPDAFREWVAYVPAKDVAALAGATSEWGFRHYRRVWAQSEGGETLDRLLYLNLRTYLLDDLLPKVDRMSMAHGLEVRSPLLDHHLLEFALRLPRDARIKGLSLKRVLKAAVSDLLPSDLLNRRKRGFGVPLDRWFRTDLRRLVEAKLLSRDARVNGFLRSEAVAALMAEHQTGRRNHGHALWTLLTLEVFLRQND